MILCIIHVRGKYSSSRVSLNREKAARFLGRIFDPQNESNEEPLFIEQTIFYEWVNGKLKCNYTT